MSVILGNGYITMGSGSVIQNPTGTASGYLCRAWCNWNGTGTIAIRGSNNISSITDGGVGTYTLNFTTAMANAGYSLTTSGAGTGGSDATGLGIKCNTTITTTNATVYAKLYGIGALDPPYCFSAILG